MSNRRVRSTIEHQIVLSKALERGTMRATVHCYGYSTYSVRRRPCTQFPLVHVKRCSERSLRDFTRHDIVRIRTSVRILYSNNGRRKKEKEKKTNYRVFEIIACRTIKNKKTKKYNNNKRENVGRGVPITLARTQSVRFSRIYIIYNTIYTYT